MKKCHVCGSTKLLETKQPDNLRGVTSDCKPWRDSPKIFLCQSCGNAISITSEEWLHNINYIYDNYEIYSQGSFKDHNLFEDKNAISRSSKLIEGMRESNLLDCKGNLLEIGPGEGNFLKEFSCAFPNWDLFANDFNDNAKDRISSEIKIKKFFSGDISNISTKFDLVTLVHSLEHIPDPINYLAKIKSLLKPSGKLLINVPNCLDNPFVLCVVDHCSHFTPATLNRLVEKAEFEIKFTSTTLISKELVVLAENNPSRHDSKKHLPPVVSIDTFNNHFDWLGLTLKQLKPLARRHYFGCLGTTIAGTWVYSQLDNELDFFADEDPGRQGKSHLNLPILSPNQIPSGSKLFLAFPYQLAENIASKFKGFNFDVILPPKNI